MAQLADRRRQLRAVLEGITDLEADLVAPGLAGAVRHEREHLAAAGLELVDLRGILLKPLANRQIEGVWTPQMLDGFYELGQDLPELCAEILAVCTPGSR